MDILGFSEVRWGVSGECSFHSRTKVVLYSEKPIDGRRESGVRPFLTAITRPDLMTLEPVFWQDIDFEISVQIK